MPKENTHLWFARTLTTAFGPADELCFIREEQLFFFLGSIIPDVFFYHPCARVRRMARVLHGSDPEWGNRTPARLVRLAGESKTFRDKAFVLGYLSHLALDQVFHPVVHVLSGKRNGTPSSTEIIAKHRLVETALDRVTKHSCFYPRIILPCFGDRVASLQSLAQDVGLIPRDVRLALTIQHLANRLILGRFTHSVLARMHHPPLLNLSTLRNLCYAQLEQEPAFAVNTSAGSDRSDFATAKALHAVLRIRWPRLFAQSRKNAQDMFRACTAYWRNDLSENALVEALPKHACD